jgi:hypothetical protein
MIKPLVKAALAKYKEVTKWLISITTGSTR